MPKALGAFSVRVFPVPANVSLPAPDANTSSPTEVLVVMFGALVPAKFAVAFVPGVPPDQFAEELHVPLLAPVQVCAKATDPHATRAAKRETRRMMLNGECMRPSPTTRISRWVSIVGTGQRGDPMRRRYIPNFSLSNSYGSVLLRGYFTLENRPYVSREHSNRSL